MHSKKQIFIEREVKVIFDEGWSVIKLDEHRYYKRLSGLGFSGVDFLAVHPDFGLALIELKNYTEGKASKPNDLDQKMIAKKNDAVRLINIIYKYFQRQLYFRILIYIGWEYLYPQEWLIWLRAKKHLDRDNVFFLGVVDY
jgi:hypothetical protein